MGVAMQQYEETNYHLEEPIIPLEEEEKEENCAVEHVGYCQHYVDQGGACGKLFYHPIETDNNSQNSDELTGMGKSKQEQLNTMCEILKAILGKVF